MKIEILCTGDEILTGKTVNTNHSYIAQRFTENALTVHWGTTVGDDRESLTTAFRQASERADAVIVNGGLGPTVDDLSQEVAAAAAGVELECNQEWLVRLKAYYEDRGRVMPENNIKQAMLPAGAEFIDNPIGTACGFAVDINNCRFFFTPGVPREMYRMINEQVVPRLLAMRGTKVVTRLKRFHTFGIGESRADRLLEDVINPDEQASGLLKLGFQTHYPQLETKLSAQAGNEEELDALLKPAEAELRKRLGNFILCEDDESLETLILNTLAESDSTLSCIEMTTGGAIASRLMKHEQSKQVLKQCRVSHQPEQLHESPTPESPPDISTQSAVALAEALNLSTGSTHALVVLTREDMQTKNPSIELCIGIADPSGTSQRQAILQGRTGWTRLGATELGLDCLRRHLLGFPVDEKIDFEQQ